MRRSCIINSISRRLTGRKIFHVKNISLSYRMRGIVPRSQMNRVLNIVVLITSHMFSDSIFRAPGIKSVAVISLINKIFMYSAIKIIANRTLLYSVLNPDTSSDSPSARSKGVRLVSARDVVNHIVINGIAINVGQVVVSVFNDVMFIELNIIKVLSIISAIDTSYEMVWATDRMAPIIVYLEFEDQPLIKTVYTLILDTHRK